MEHHTYQCNYCKKDYIPKRRRLQKFCSASCRVGSHQQNNKLKQQQQQQQLLPKTESNNTLLQKMKVTEMSLAGVGNSLLGVAAVEVAKSLLIKSENKPATKADLEKLSSRLERFQEIRNMSKNMLGKKPFYDNVLKGVVYM